MFCTTEYDFACHSLESQTFNLQKRRNDGHDHRIIAVVKKILYLKKKKFFFKFIKEKKIEKIVYLKKKKYLIKFWTWKPENVVRILRKFYTWKKLSKSEVRQKKFWERL